MGCKTCKDKKGYSQTVVTDEVGQSEPKKMNRFVGFLIFLLTLIFVPFSIPIMIGVLFNYFVLQNSLNPSPLIKKIKTRPREH
jgi:hypothetical protein